MATADTKIILALDLSLSATGWAILQIPKVPVENRKNIGLLDYGEIPTSAKASTGSRLQLIENEIIRIGNTFLPDVVAIEQGFVRNNIASKQLAKVLGIAEKVFREIPIYFYPPLTVKKEVTGNGFAKKEEVSIAVNGLFPNLAFNNISDNVTDAVAVGLTHIHKTQNENQKAG